MTVDPLVVLAELPEVARAGEEARDAVDRLLWDRPARARGMALSAESTVLGAWASAAFEGAEVGIDTLRSGAVEDSPIGLVAARTLAMYSTLPRMADIVLTAPLQALAQLHAVVAVDHSEGDELGRPRATDDVSDPLRFRLAVPAAEVPHRLNAIAELLTSQSAAPAVVLAGVVHAELATAQPFVWGSGVIARSMTRLIMRAKGVDPDGWTIPEAGIRMLGRPKYITALKGYATGEPTAVANWLVVHSRIISAGATAAADMVADLPTD